MQNKEEIEIYTDGSSRGNPGRGGWGAILLFPNGKVKELGGAEENTTNNRMELMAIMESLKYIESRKDSPPAGGKIVLYTDSTYAQNGLLGWMYAWEKKGWKTATNEEVKNEDLWKELFGLVYRARGAGGIDVNKVEGHSGLFGNERCDAIATSYADGKQVLLFSGSVGDYEKVLGGSVHDVTPKAKRDRATAYSYVSLANEKIKTHKTWEECEKEVRGVSGAKWKKAKTKEEEKELLRGLARV